MADRPQKTAFEAAKEIVVARVTNAQHSTNKESGKNVAEYFESIYNKLLEIATSFENE